MKKFMKGMAAMALGVAVMTGAGMGFSATTEASSFHPQQMEQNNQQPPEQNQDQQKHHNKHQKPDQKPDQQHQDNDRHQNQDNEQQTPDRPAPQE